MAYNLALQQIRREQKGEYLNSDVGLISQLMGQIRNGVNTQGQPKGTTLYNSSI